jgi:HAMP domain-containing protein
MGRLFSRLLGGRLRLVLVASLCLVAALTVGLNTLATSRVIGDYLTAAEDERVARDMDLARAFYQLKLDEIAAISHRLVLDPWVIENLGLAARGDPRAIQIIDQQITNKIAVLALGGTHLIALLDQQGDLLVGRVLSADGQLSPLLGESQWGNLPIVAATLSSGSELAATEVLPAYLLAQVGLQDQARVPLLDTPRAAPRPFDVREGTAGLALTGVAPLLDGQGRVVGAALAAYLFNNDFTLVDRIKQVAGIDTVTIFFGDLRVSTNVMTAQGERAVGTRISQEVYQVVLQEGRDYVGQAFVVNENYITRYTPVLDHRGKVAGSLYVGARESAFRALLEAFNERVALIGLVSLVLAGVIALPFSRLVTGPIGRLVEATRRLAAGDMNVRVEAQGRGELAALAQSFNSMVETSGSDPGNCCVRLSPWVSCRPGSPTTQQSVGHHPIVLRPAPQGDGGGRPAPSRPAPDHRRNPPLQDHRRRSLELCPPAGGVGPGNRPQPVAGAGHRGRPASAHFRRRTHRTPVGRRAAAA